MHPSERRRHPRYETARRATVRAEGASCAGEIRDFCRTGLFVAFERPAPPETTAALAPGAGATLEFPAPGTSGAQMLRVTGRVVRSARTGVAMQVDELSPEAWRALVAAARRLHDPAPNASPAAVDPATRARIRDACEALLAGMLDDLLRELGRRVPEALEDDAREADESGVRARLRDAAADVRMRADDVAAGLTRAMRDALRTPAAAKPATKPADEVELSLVDDADFEDWLGLSTVIHRIEADLGPALATLHRRHGALQGAELDRDTDPLAPAGIGRALQEALRGAGVSQHARTAVYRVFGETFAGLAPPFYERINGTLAPMEPPARAPARGDAPPGARARSEEPPAWPPVPPHADAGHPMTTIRPFAVGGPAHGPQAVAGGFPLAGPPSFPGAAPFQGAAASAAGAAPWSAGVAAPHAGSGTGPHAPWYAAPQVGQDAAPHLGPAHGPGPSAAPPHGPAFAAPATGPLELLERLRRVAEPAAPGPGALAGAAAGTGPGLPAAADAAPHGASEAAGAAPGLGACGAPPADGGAGPCDAPAAAPVEALRRALDALPAAGGDEGPTSSSLAERLGAALGAWPAASVERRRLDSTAGLLDRALAEPGVADDVRRLLQRLERPLLKLVLGEDGFPGAADHPARRAVDLLEQCAIATDDRGRFVDPALASALDALVARVAAGADADPALYRQACDDVERLLEPVRETRRRRVARQQQACESRERARRARRRVDDAIAQRFEGRDVPVPLARLVRDGWRQHLTLLELRDGTTAPARDEAWAELDRLDAWLQPGFVPGPGWRQAAAAAAGRIASTLSAVVVDGLQRDALLESVERALEAVAEGAGAPPAVRWPARERDPADEAPSADLAAWADGLRLGDWWLLPRDDGAPRPMQLIWTSRPAGRCAFASRSALERVELTLEALSATAADGTARRCADQDAPVLERAEAALLDEGRDALMHRALHDAVTGLPNRKGLMRALSRAPRAGRRAVGVLEFDGLRMIWTACGVEVAETLTRELVRIARECVGPDALLASFRDDALAFVLPPSPDDGRAVVDALAARLADHRVDHGEQTWRIAVNVGVAGHAPPEIGHDEAVRRAEAACAAARSLGRNRVQAYESDSAPVRQQESIVDWAGRIDRLLEGSGLALRCQRIEAIGDDPSLRAYYEVLLTVETEPGVWASPAPLVETIERLGRSQELDLWVMRRVFDWIAAHPEAYERIGGFAINLSARSLESAEVLAWLQERLADPRTRADKLTFEITETAAIERYDAAQRFVQRVRRHGCRFSLDDFGNGHASFAHLRHLRTDVLKIDGAFVRGVAADPADLAIVRSMHEIARSLGMRTVAECVETPEVLAALRTIGVDHAQGWAIHRPCPIDALAAVVSRERALARSPDAPVT